jgi:SAM-dependent methyltransferase
MFAEQTVDDARNMTARQKSELDFHIEYAARNRHLINEPVDLDVCHAPRRRWWNAYWSLYDRVRELPLQGKRVLIPGCGFGEDCIRVAEFGAEVHGFDLSPEVAAIAAARAKRFSHNKKVFIRAMPCERMDYDDGFFDVVLLVNILHHVDITRTMAEVARVAKPDAIIIGLEMYTHSLAQRVRESDFLSQKIYPLVAKRIYGGDPYITPDERKLNERDLGAVTGYLRDCQYDFFSIIADRLFSNQLTAACKADKLLAKAMGPLGKLFAGRVIFSGARA